MRCKLQYKHDAVLVAAASLHAACDTVSWKLWSNLISTSLRQRLIDIATDARMRRVCLQVVCARMESLSDLRAGWNYMQAAYNNTSMPMSQ